MAETEPRRESSSDGPPDLELRPYVDNVTGEELMLESVGTMWRDGDRFYWREANTGHAYSEPWEEDVS